MIYISFIYKVINIYIYIKAAQYLCKDDRQIKEKKDPRNRCTDIQTVIAKVALQIRRGRADFSTNDANTSGYPYVKK